MNWSQLIQHLQNVMILSLGNGCFYYFYQSIVEGEVLAQYGGAALSALVTFVIYMGVVSLKVWLKKRL